jgi:hypothetical protein
MSECSIPVALSQVDHGDAFGYMYSQYAAQVALASDDLMTYFAPNRRKK